MAVTLRLHSEPILIRVLPQDRSLKEVGEGLERSLNTILADERAQRVLRHYAEELAAAWAVQVVYGWPPPTDLAERCAGDLNAIMSGPVFEAGPER